MTLVIVESPTKAKTINNFLGKDFNVISSGGHVRDLPKGKIGVDTEKNFEIQFVIPRKVQKRVSEIKKLAKKDSDVILATDEDREGEAISYHLAYILGLKDKDIKRIVFHEITEDAIQQALQNPRKIDLQLVDAQKARRVLDRLVGFSLSPFLWKKISYGLSAGRVQSVALKMIIDKEKEIQKFRPQDYWDISAKMASKGSQFEAFVTKQNNKTIPPMGIDTKEKAEKIVSSLKKANCNISKIDQRKRTRKPFAPFSTSTLQQAAAARFGFPAKRTMAIAQKLYENGFITYPRTDSLNLSKESIASSRQYIKQEIGPKYIPSKERFYKSRSKGAQEAHEAIRPAFSSRSPLKNRTPAKLKLEPAAKKLYTLIWQRFLASQMADAEQLQTSIDIKTDTPYGLHANGIVTKFDGFTKIYPTELSENKLPQLEEKDKVAIKKVQENKHTTQPPARYSDASLIKELEKNGIGRPSTYASIISTLNERNYIEKNEQKRMQPTQMGTMVNTMISKNFPDIVNKSFTAQMEKDLDEISIGKKDWQKTLSNFYKPFEKNLKQKEKDVKSEKVSKETGEKCPDCGKEILEKFGRFGPFYACSGFPECKFSKPIEREDAFSAYCIKCVEGQVKEKHTRKGKIFYGCNRYPDCDYALWDKPLTKSEDDKNIIQRCEKCKEKAALVEKKYSIECSNKECKYKKKIAKKEDED